MYSDWSGRAIRTRGIGAPRWKKSGARTARGAGPMHDGQSYPPMPVAGSGNDVGGHSPRVVEADAAAYRAHYDRGSNADLGADPPANGAANRGPDECKRAAHRVAPERNTPSVTSDAGPRLRFLRFVLILELGDHGRIGQRGGVAQRAAFGDVAQKTAHDLARPRFRQIGAEQDIVGLGKRADLLGHVVA